MASHSKRAIIISLGGWSLITALNYMHTVDTFYMHIWQ